MEGQKRPQSTAREPSEDGFEVKKLINESRVWVLCLPFRFIVLTVLETKYLNLSPCPEKRSLSLFVRARAELTIIVCCLG